LRRHTKYCISFVLAELSKLIKIQGSAPDDLRAFPASARREPGYQLDKVQSGFDPTDWKPMNTVGQGVREIGIRDKTARSG
jgi:phage-related protein